MNIYYTPEVNQQIKNILWKHANLYIDFRIATIEEDTQHATDMKIEMRGKSIALRMREPGCKYRDFTLRSRVASGNKTEIHKLRDGEGDIYLYGWLNHDRIIEEYIIVDIHELRATHIIDDDRTCQEFTKWRQGFTPKEHREMLDRKDFREWQEKQRKSDRWWRIIEVFILVVFAGLFTLLGAFIGRG